MISASFKLSGKLSVIRHLLKRSCKVSGEVLQLIFNILGGIVFLVVAFLRSIFWISFSMPNFDVGWKEKKGVWFSNLLLIEECLGGIYTYK